MTESLPSSAPGEQKRRSTRIAQAVPITVSGVDALGQPFKERTTTVMVNCHGCKYQSKHYVPKNSVVTLEIPRMEPAFPPRAVQGHVAWVQRPRTVRELFQIGVEFEVAGNVWGIAFPPEDWFPCPDEQAPEGAPAGPAGKKVETGPVLEKSEIRAETKPEPSRAPESKAADPAPAVAPTPPAVTPATPAQPAAKATAGPSAPPPAATVAPASPSTKINPAAPAPATAGGEAKIHVMPSPAAGSPDAQSIARQMAKVVAEAKETLDKTLRRGAQTAINEEMANLRQQLDAQMHETVEHAIKSSIERVSESEVKKVIQQAANKTAAIVEEARVASEVHLAQIDAKVHEAVQQAVNQAAEQAASRAGSQVASATEEARRTIEANIQQVEERARKAAQEAATLVASATEQARRAAEVNLHLAEETIRKAAEESARLAANRAIQQTVSQDFKQSVEEVVARTMAEREAKLPSLQLLSAPDEAQARIEEWKKKLEQTVADVQTRASTQAEAEADAANRKWREELEATIAGSTAKVDEKCREVSQAALARTEREIAERSTTLRTLLNEVISGAEASIHSLGIGLAQERTNAEQARAQLEEAAKLTIDETRRRFDEMVASHNEAVQGRFHEVSDAALERATAELADAQRQFGRLQNELHEQARQVSEQAAQTKSGALEYVQQAASEAVQAALLKLADAAHQSDRLQESIRGQLEQASAQLALTEHAARERVEKESEAAVQRAVAELAFAGQEAVRLQNVIREQAQRASELADQAGRDTREKVQQAANAALQEATSELHNAVGQATQLQQSMREQAQQAMAQLADTRHRLREQIGQTSEEALRQYVERMRQEVGKFPGELEQNCRGTVSKFEEELEQKTSEMQHAAYEALLKAAEWYQKKAQTNMQSTMERMIEQASSAMKDKAGEVSNMVAAELDHYRRTYVEHGRGQFEEAAKEVLDRERLRLNETAEIANATFTDRAQHALHESLHHLHEASRKATEKAHEDLRRSREDSLDDFQKKLDEKITQSVEHAATYLQSQLIPMLEAWEEKRQAEREQWIEHLKEAAEDSITAYKARLENTTNGWLLASAATLGQNSQAVLDSLSKTAEKRIRETCSRVVAGMADALSGQLRGMSTSFGAEQKENETET